MNIEYINSLPVGAKPKLYKGYGSRQKMIIEFVNSGKAYGHVNLDDYQGRQKKSLATSLKNAVKRLHVDHITIFQNRGYVYLINELMKEDDINV